MFLVMSNNNSDQIDNSQIYSFQEKVVNVNRVTKVVKGGRIMSFSALVVVGDGNGKVGYGLGRAKEVSLAVQKAAKLAHKNLYNVEIQDGTIYYPSYAKYCATKVMVMPAKSGSGVIAGGAMRAVFDVVGISNITAKIHGSSNPHNVIKATINALINIESNDYILRKRGKK